MTHSLRFFLVILFSVNIAFAAPVPKVRNPPDKDKIQGKWQVVQRLENDKERSGVEECYWIFQGDQCTIDKGTADKFAIDETTNPKQLDILEESGRSYLGLYELDGDKLIWRNTGPGGNRPEAMTGPGHTIIFKRVKD